MIGLTHHMKIPACGGADVSHPVSAPPYGPRPQRLRGASGKGMPFGGETKKAKRSRSAWTKIVKSRADIES